MVPHEPLKRKQNLNCKRIFKSESLAFNMLEPLVGKLLVLKKSNPN